MEGSMDTTEKKAGLAVYARVSGDEQRRQGTIENQHVAADRYLTAHALSAYGTYEDDGVTGALLFAGRPAGARLLADVRAGHVGIVLVTKLDRFGRNPRQILNAVHELELAGARLISIKENVDTRTIAGKFFLTVLSGVAELERDMILERTAEGQALRLESSPWMGGHAPLGFRVEGEKKHAGLAINDLVDATNGPSEVDAVRLAWYLFLQQ